MQVVEDERKSGKGFVIQQSWAMHDNKSGGRLQMAAASQLKASSRKQGKQQETGQADESQQMQQQY